MKITLLLISALSFAAGADVFEEVREGMEEKAMIRRENDTFSKNERWSG
jgi:hypothetical protein